MAKAAASHTKSALTGLSTSSPKAPDNELRNRDSHVDTQQTFRFMDLPSELCEIIHSLALHPNTKKAEDVVEIRDEPHLTAGLSNSNTARTLSQVCRTVRQEGRDVPSPSGRRLA